MKRLVLGIAFAFLPACVVGTPVAEEQKSTEQQLREDIGPMCDGGCQRAAECNFDASTDCPAHCREYMAAFVGHGDECVTLGKSVVDCVAPRQSCSDYENVDECDVSEHAHEQCASAGSVGPVPPVFCDGDGGTSAGVAPGANGEPARTTSCDLYFGNCSDSANYRVSCHALDAGLVCNCFKDGVVSGEAFTPTDNVCPAEDTVNASCGWNIQ